LEGQACHGGSHNHIRPTCAGAKHSELPMPEAYVPATARGDVTKAIASIRYSAKVIADRLPDVDSWITAHGG